MHTPLRLECLPFCGIGAQSVANIVDGFVASRVGVPRKGSGPERHTRVSKVVHTPIREPCALVHAREVLRVRKALVNRSRRIRLSCNNWAEIRVPKVIVASLLTRARTTRGAAVATVYRPCNQKKGSKLGERGKGRGRRGKCNRKATR